MKQTREIGVFVLALMPMGFIASPNYAQDADHGKSVFKACMACHTTDQNNRVGPGLGGVVGRKAGTAAGFNYSSAMKNSDIVWDAASLDAFLESPKKAVPGNKMPFAGIKDQAARADVIGYLTTLK